MTWKTEKNYGKETGESNTAPLHVWQGSNHKLTLEPSGIVARVSTERVLYGAVNGFPIHTTQYGEIEGLPAR